MIYYEDRDIIVCEKPYGVSSQLSSGENMIQILKSHTGCEIFPVHRLDIGTSGVMVYAKNKESASRLSIDISNHCFEKEYLCICHGAPYENGEMIDYLYHDRIKNKSFIAKTKRNGSKEARLKFWTIARSKNVQKELSLVRVLLETGRTHQIRAQFSSRGYFLYGDGKYGARDNDKIALHSYKIVFKHPTTKKQMEYKSLPNGGIWDSFDLNIIENDG
ncbi:MAG: RluA family pseudouridine synthase [Clostridia bacterium]|nr:RluA family pseudouridine synthase [Clostridia bacterium]MBQ7789401.1 RluA family pseudouridine synthase [Clostridia bacterium]